MIKIHEIKKGKIFPVLAMKVLDGGEWLTSHPSHFGPRREPR
jgi:hypothetical protein